MNSLKIKILGLASAIMIMAVALTGWHNLQTQRAMLSRFADQSSRVLGETIRNSIITSMASGQNSEVANILEKIRKEPTIEAVRIFDEAGRILISADPTENGEMISSSDLHAYRTKTLSFTKTLENEREVHSTILTIFNSQSCYGCHDSQIGVLGVLNVQVSLGELVLLQKKGREATILSSVGMLVILILTISGFILFYVDAPIRKLMAAMDYLEQGDFEKAHTRVGSSAEMSLLSTKFNLMVDRLKGLMETAVRNERRIAINQEKLAHHEEIQNMNVTLEERLQEIEYLNISLEERIEEIEEANYKIADLAGDLEDRNTNLTNAVSRLSALYKMGLAINSTMEHDKLFELLLRKTIATLHTKVGYILLFDKERSSLSIGSSVGLPANRDPELRIPLQDGGVSHWVINNRQPLLIKEIGASGAFNRESMLGFTRETVICAPLIVKDEVIGTITMANKLDLSPFTGEDLELLSTIAAQASVAIKNARLYEEQQHSYLSTVQALVSAVEASDAYTRGHSERVTRYSLALARQMELPAESCKRLEQAAILHDIGKIGIDLALLNKEEDLSPGDIDILRQHPLIGDRILEPIHFLKGVREIIVQHHERFDGRGYPQGIRGEELLLESRILSVADTYDAMTSDRPYRKALTHLTARGEIEKNSATQFDPQVVDAFLILSRDGGLTG